MPEKTWECRQCHALKIGNGSGANRPGVYFLGGVHAREWGSSDILINFIERIEQAYLTNTALAFRSKVFSAAEIKSIVDTLDIVIFPQVNPDGRHHSMTSDESDWRANRRPAPPHISAECIGVDLNRNYDFLWDFPTHFAPNTVKYTSLDPCSAYYHGESAFSEPETRNVRSIVDSFPNIRFFVDLHSSGQLILHRWGDAPVQIDRSDMNFMNRSYDGVRGLASYKEYIPGDDLAASKSLAAALRDGIGAVRGTVYGIEQSYGLYPTAAASDDFFYSRHWLDGREAPILSFTLEWGDVFQPAWPEMQHIIDEVTAGLIAYCLKAVAMSQARGRG